jgi:hypothetical protein
VEHCSRLRGRLPDALLPIAAAAGGNLICISVAEGRAGEIYFWNHELGHLGRTIERLAASFDDFVSQLHALPPPVLQPDRVISVEVDPEFQKWVREQEELEDLRPTLRWPRGDS